MRKRLAIASSGRPIILILPWASASLRNGFVTIAAGTRPSTTAGPIDGNGHSMNLRGEESPPVASTHERVEIVLKSPSDGTGIVAPLSCLPLVIGGSLGTRM